MLVGGAAIGGRDHDVLQLMPANADDGTAFGVDRRDIEMARLDVGKESLWHFQLNILQAGRF